MTDEEKASAIALVPLSRIGTPDDLGKAAVFLASDDSAYITGIELFVDGGAAQSEQVLPGGVHQGVAKAIFTGSRRRLSPPREARLRP